MGSQPSTAPTHHTGMLCPSASRKFSVLMETSSALQMTRVRLFGAGKSETITLPMTMASPAQVLMRPSAVSPPCGTESTMAGSAALYMDATKLMAAKKRMRSKMPRFAFKNCSPARTFSSMGARFDSASVCGILMPNSSVKNATANVVRSNAMTAYMPPNASSAVARTPVSTEFSEFENDRRPLVRW